jgi:hypothetical protein
LELVIEHQTERSAAATLRESVRYAGRDDEKIPRPRGPGALTHALRAFSGKVQDQLGPVVLVGRHLGLPVSVQLEFPQNKAQRMDLDFLNEDRTPS